MNKFKSIKFSTPIDNGFQKVIERDVERLIESGWAVYKEFNFDWRGKGFTVITFIK